MNTKITCPCYQCKDRVAGCQQNCESYRTWHTELQDRKNAYISSVKEDAEYRSYHKKKSLRYYKKFGHL